VKRREFLKSSMVAATLGSLTASSTATAADEASPENREFYELRLYRLRIGPMQKAFDAFFGQAAIPALNRAGVSPVGVFNVMFGPENPTMYVLLPCKSFEGLASAWRQVEADPEYQKAGADFLNAPASEPAYVRMESSFMIAFEGMPKLEIPAGAAGKKGRIFELRTYESASEKAGRKKIEMFNRGEISIFRRTGLQPVFFGQTLVGSKLPNLTYMLVFDNLEQRTANWGAFVADAEWHKLSATPGYTNAEVVSNISNIFLQPMPYSQI
jgi:hypothetical protein